MENDTLLSYRLRSLRSRKRTIKKDVEKQIRKKFQRSRELWKIRRNIPLIPLDQPYQKGFIRFFVVRDDVKRSKDGDFFEGILNKINTSMFSETRKFLQKKRKFGRRIYVEKRQKLNRIYSWEWNNSKYRFTAREKLFFAKHENYCPKRKTSEIYYEFTEPWRFTLRIRPNMITHYKPVDLELEKEYADLESYLWQHKVVGIINKTIHGKSYSWDSKKGNPNLIKSRKYFTCAMSATEIAESFLDDMSII